MTLRMLLSSIVVVASGLMGQAWAHPHVFIDTGFELVIDAQGRLTAVRIDWTYDAFYSLLLIEENGLDSDGDGTPEQGKLDAYAGRDVDWAAGFPGDFVVTRDGVPMALERPVDHAARFDDGRIVTSHTRPLAVPFALTGHQVVARSYDPTYFVAYDVPRLPSVDGHEACGFTRNAADRDAAQAEYGDRLAALDTPEDPFQEVELPDIGILFADSFTLKCNDLS